jgi:hypothetical protein
VSVADKWVLAAAQRDGLTGALKKQGHETRVGQATKICCETARRSAATAGFVNQPARYGVGDRGTPHHHL